MTLILVANGPYILRAAIPALALGAGVDPVSETRPKSSVLASTFEASNLQLPAFEIKKVKSIKTRVETRITVFDVPEE